MAHFRSSGSPSRDDGSGGSDDSRGAGTRTKSNKQISFGRPGAPADPFQNRLKQQNQEKSLANLGLISPKEDEEDYSLGEQMSASYARFGRVADDEGRRGSPRFGDGHGT